MSWLINTLPARGTIHVQIKKIPPGVGGVLTTSYQRISQKPVRTSFEKQLDPGVQWLLEGRSVFLRKPIVTCDFQGGRGSRPHAHPCYTSCVARTYILCACTYLISVLAGLLRDTYSILIGNLDPFHAEYLYVLYPSHFCPAVVIQL